MVIEIIQKEIPTRGIGYIILRDCPEDRLGDALGKGMERLKKAGAQTVLATSLPEGEPLHPGPVGVWRLTHVHDMVSMERPLPTEKPAMKLNLRAPRRGQEETLYLNLTNKAFAQVPGAADKGHLKLGLVDVVHVVGGGEDLALVDVVDLNGLQNLGLHEMADAALGHDGDGDGLLDAPNHLRVAHAGNAAGCPDVRRDALQRHDGTGACGFGDLRLLRRGDVHDDAALEHLGQLLI